MTVDSWFNSANLLWFHGRGFAAGDGSYSMGAGSGCTSEYAWGGGYGDDADVSYSTNKGYGKGHAAAFGYVNAKGDDTAYF